MFASTLHSHDLVPPPFLFEGRIVSASLDGQETEKRAEFSLLVWGIFKVHGLPEDRP